MVMTLMSSLSSLIQLNVTFQNSSAVHYHSHESKHDAKITYNIN